MIQEIEPKKRYNIFEEQDRARPGVARRVNGCPFCHRYIPDFIAEDIRNQMGGPLECIHCGRTLNSYLRQIYRYEVICPSCGVISWHEDDRPLEVLQKEANILCHCGEVLNPYLTIYKWAHLYTADCCGISYILRGNENPEIFRKEKTYSCKSCGLSLNMLAQIVF